MFCAVVRIDLNRTTYSVMVNINISSRLSEKRREKAAFGELSKPNSVFNRLCIYVLLNTLVAFCDKSKYASAE